MSPAAGTEINSTSGLVNLPVGLRDFLKTLCAELEIKISWNSFVEEDWSGVNITF